MKSLRGVAAAALLISTALVAPAHAGDLRSFISATCGAGCADSVGEASRARENWSSLKTMGTTKYVGASMGSTKIDAGSLLSASRVAGPVELDRYLTTGQSSSPSIMTAITGALGGGSGLDVSQIVGLGSSSSSTLSPSSSNPLTQLASLGLGTSVFQGPGGGGSGYCDPAVASTQNASAQSFINNIMTVATGSEFGFSQQGGVPISTSQRSPTGLFGGSCLDSFMKGTQDLLFRPPQLSSLLGQLSSMFGSTATGCGAMPNIMAQLTGSMPNGIFTSSTGGFFPYQQFGAGESGTSSMLDFTNAFNLLTPTSTSSTAGTSGSLSTLFR